MSFRTKGEDTFDAPGDWQIQDSVAPVTNGSARSVLLPCTASWRPAQRRCPWTNPRRLDALNLLRANHLRLTWRNGQRYALLLTLRQRSVSPGLVTITLNGEPYQLDGPVSVSTLLAMLSIDGRRVAVEHNLVVVRRAVFDTTMIGEGDEIEIVNFVGGG
jgi:sulfur carrier protein